MVANEGQDKIALAVKDRLEHELRYAADRPTSLSYPDGIDLLAFHGDLAEFLCNACKRASASANTNHGARGGKPGLKGHSGLLSFIQHVVTRVLRAGGQLPHQKASPELIALLEALRQDLPCSFLPQRHPISAYNRSVEKAAKEYDLCRSSDQIPRCLVVNN